MTENSEVEVDVDVEYIPLEYLDGVKVVLTRSDTNQRYQTTTTSEVEADRNLNKWISQLLNVDESELSDEEE